MNGEADYYEARFGFIRDTDDDGKYDFEDLCPTRSGTLSNGCPSPPPPRDTDGDGIVDTSDHCPSENSRARDPGANGCLDRLLLHPEIRLNPGSFCKNGRCLGLKAKSVTVSDIPAGTKVTVSCTRGACRTKSSTLGGKRSRLTVKIKKNLRAGVRLKIRVTKSGAVGRYVSYKILRNDYDRDRRVTCLRPGGRTPLACNSKLWVK